MYAKWMEARVKITSIPFVIIDDFVTKFIENKIAEGERPQVVGGNQGTDEDLVTKCDECETMVYMRPNIAALAEKYKLKVICRVCVGEEEYKKAEDELINAIDVALEKDG